MEDKKENQEKKVPKFRKKRKKKSVEKENKTNLQENVADEEDDIIIDILDDDLEENTGRGKKILLITLASIVGTVVAVYLGFVLFFNFNFYFFTTLNGNDVSMRSEKYVSSFIKKQVENYELNVIEKGGIEESISGKDIDLKYIKNEKIKKEIHKQNPWLWPQALFVKSKATITVDVEYDENKLEDRINKLQSVTAKEQTDPVNAYPKYENGAYVIEPEVYGTKVDTKQLLEQANKHVSEFNHELDMEKDSCYLSPKYVSKSKEVIDACNTMNKYIKAEITYNMGSTNEVVNADVISKWLQYDDSMHVSINAEAVAAYLADLAARYNTVGTTRTFTTPTGRAVEVSGGTYGWIIDEEAEKKALIANIEASEVVAKEPAYSQRAASRDVPDWGTTYCEVDISAQHMWLVSEGAVAMESDVVTGAVNNGHDTPVGVYEILEMLSPTVLKGDIVPGTNRPEYMTPVDFWMRVTWSGIGFHDATWQSSFGGTRYMDGAGSHGCINMPYGQAQTLYSMLQTGTPVVVHY